MSNDRYQEIREALAMGPTRGPRKWWEHEDFGYCCVNPLDGGLLIAKCDVRDPFDPEQRANAALIAACDPDTIRALLEERDALREVLGRILENEASDYKAAEEFGGYVLDDELREEARAVLSRRKGGERCVYTLKGTTSGSAM